MMRIALSFYNSRITVPFSTLYHQMYDHNYSFKLLKMSLKSKVAK